MKKALLLATLALSLGACKKEAADSCYTCTFGIDSNGTQMPPRNWCGDPRAQFYDSNGMPVPSNCTR
jgi:hypothetical protein